MAKKFEMGDYLKTLAPVSGSDTGREQIEYIDVDLLDRDPNNFYDLSQLDALADNIATVGLQQPVRVRDGQDGHVVIVSGHRRTAAIRKLVAEGRTDLREVPCIREKSAGSAALQELRLIYANSDTRDLSSSEISRQADRVRALLYQLQEEGHEFPGRMRDHVAEACKVSRTKLARLDAIRNNLAPNIRKAYWDGPKEKSLTESTAYELSRLPAEMQNGIVSAYATYCGNNSYGLRYLSADTVTTIAKEAEEIRSRKTKCPEGGSCTYQEGQIARVVERRVKDKWCYNPCGGKCCGECNYLESCKAACPKMRDKQKALKAQSKAQKQQEAADRQAEERPAVERITALWQRFGVMRERAGLTAKEFFEKIDCPYGRPAHDAEEHEEGRKIDAHTELPYGYNVYLSDINRWLTAAEMLGCSVDYLMMRTDEPRTADEVTVAANACAGQTSLAAWMPGGTTPAAPCDAVADFDLGGGKTIRVTCYWDGEAFLFKKGKETINADVVRWLALPEVEKEEDV